MSFLSGFEKTAAIVSDIIRKSVTGPLTQKRVRDEAASKLRKARAFLKPLAKAKGETQVMFPAVSVDAGGGKKLHIIPHSKGLPTKQGVWVK